MGRESSSFQNRGLIILQLYDYKTPPPLGGFLISSSYSLGEILFMESCYTESEWNELLIWQFWYFGQIRLAWFHYVFYLACILGKHLQWLSLISIFVEYLCFIDALYIYTYNFIWQCRFTEIGKTYVLPNYNDSQHVTAAKEYFLIHYMYHTKLSTSGTSLVICNSK